MIVHEDDPYNAEAPPGALAGQERTPNDTFYGRNHGPVPVVEPQRWRLRVDGLVRRRLTLSLDDLQRHFAAHSVLATLQCAGNRRAGFLPVHDIPGEDPWGPGATSNAEWTGVRLSDVLTAARPDAGARHVAFEGPDRSEIATPPQSYGASIPLAKARGHEVLLAWAMNGEPLPAVHGAPVRMVVPGWIGARSVKWLQRIELRDEPSSNYFQSVAYRLLSPEADPAAAGPGDGLSLGPIALNCAVLAPADGSIVAPGEIEVTGYALAGDDRAVARVDVSPDGGRTWGQARLDAPTSPWTWQLWRTRVRVTGPCTIVARAWDSTGAQQPESAATLWNPKGYVNNSWDRVMVSTGE